MPATFHRKDRLNAWDLLEHIAPFETLGLSPEVAWRMVGDLFTRATLKSLLEAWLFSDGP